MRCVLMSSKRSCSTTLRPLTARLRRESRYRREWAPRQVSQTKGGGRALAEPVVPFPGGIATNIPYEDRYPLELVQRDFKDPVEGATAQLLCAEEVAVLLELRDQLRTRDLGSAGDAPELSRHRRDDRPQAFWRGRR